MKKSNFAKYSNRELQKFITDIQSILNKREQEEASQLKKREALLATMEEKGLSETDLLAMLGLNGGKKTGAKVAAKYRNPENSLETWTGRGRQPRWVVAALDSGKTYEDISI